MSGEIGQPGPPGNRGFRVSYKALIINMCVTPFNNLKVRRDYCSFLNSNFASNLIKFITEMFHCGHDPGYVYSGSRHHKVKISTWSFL